MSSTGHESKSEQFNKERLQEIKYRHAIGVETIPEELEWLISEVERLQAENEKWKRAYHKLDPVGFILNEPLKQTLETEGKRVYSIWIDKYHGVREHGEYWDAHKIDDVEATSFDEAMEKHIAKSEQPEYYRKDEKTGKWYCWGVEVYHGE
jgi:hypothetical protein